MNFYGFLFWMIVGKFIELMVGKVGVLNGYFGYGIGKLKLKII